MWTWGQLAKIDRRISYVYTCRTHVVKSKHWHIALSQSHYVLYNTFRPEVDQLNPSENLSDIGQMQSTN